MISGIAFILTLVSGLNPALTAQKPAVPEMSFSTFQKQLTLNTDSVYVINFWATWCAPCRKELPLFEKIHHDFSDKKVRVLLVSLDFPNQAKKTLGNFIETNKITAPVVLLNEPDANSWINIVDPSWSGAIPATLIYKKSTRKFFEKELTYDEISNSISNLNKF